MKVIHIITGLGDGGAEGVLYRLCLSAVDETHHVISLMGEGKYGRLLEEAGISVTYLGMAPGRVTTSGLRRLWRILRGQPTAVVQTWMYHADLIGGMVARLAGNTRVVWNVRHTTLDPRVTALSTRVVARTAALLSRFVPGAIIVCADAARDSHIEYGYARSKICVVHNGYDTSALKEASLADDLALLRAEHAGPLLGNVGRFVPEKDHRNLLEALGRLASKNELFHCVLAGPGVVADNRQLSDWIGENGLEEYVTLLGPRDDVPRIMKALDLYILASNDEGFPNVLAEAMACGTPCVTTDVGDAAMIVGDAGWAVPARSPEQLAETIGVALAELRMDALVWQKRQLHSALRIEHEFAIAGMVAGYRAVWERVSAG